MNVDYDSIAFEYTNTLDIPSYVHSILDIHKKYTCYKKYYSITIENSDLPSDSEHKNVPWLLMIQEGVNSVPVIPYSMMYYESKNFNGNIINFPETLFISNNVDINIENHFEKMSKEISKLGEDTKQQIYAIHSFEYSIYRVKNKGITGIDYINFYREQEQYNKSLH